MQQIGFSTVSLDREILPSETYRGIEKRWSDRTIEYPQELIDELQNILEAYMRVMDLDTTRYPVRVDIGFSEDLDPVIYEVTTGFVDQIGSYLALQESLGETKRGDILTKTPFTSSVLTSEPYRPEYDLMRKYFAKYGRPLLEGVTDTTFVYGYPIDDMKGDLRFIPGYKGLNAEDKLTQSKVLQQLDLGNYILPRAFDPRTISFEELPDERVSKIVFKQITPKQKGDRNTIIFGKGKRSKERFEVGEMIGTEHIPSYRDSKGRRYEAKILFLPSPKGLQCLGLYVLVDEKLGNKDFANTSIPNDGYPQGPGIIT